MNDSSKVTSEIMSLILMGVLFLSMLTLVVFSASAYRASVQVQAGNDDKGGKCHARISCGETCRPKTPEIPGG